MFKKLVSIALAAVMATSIVACKDGDKPANNKGFVAGENALCDEYTVLTAFYHQNGNSEDGSWDIFKDAAKITNVGLVCTIPKSNSDSTQAFNLMIASGEMPDIVQTYNGTTFNQLGADGAFVPLNEYLDEYMPNFKKILEEYPEVRKNITAYDGNIYFTPFMAGGTASVGWFMRQDWLDKLKLDAPTDAESMYKVLTAFRNEDPNGNGEKDEIPMFNKGTLDEAMTLWDARPDWYMDNGVIKYGPCEENYKTAIENLRKWYDEDLIDPEILTRADNPRAKMLGNNVGGCCAEWIGSTAAFNDKLAESVPGINFTPIAPPSGKVLQRRLVSDNYGWGVSASSENIELAVRYLDFWFGEQGSLLMNFGREGEHFDIVDGKPIFRDGFDIQQTIKKYGSHLNVGYKQNFDYERQWINDMAYEGMVMYEENNYFVEQMPQITSNMSKEEVEEYSKLKTDIDTYADEMMQKWILGAEDISATWDEYISALESFGIARLTELQQEAYNRR